MATYTPNLNLKKPTGNEYYDVVAEDNDAKDKIDYIIGSHITQLAEVKPYINNLIADKPSYSEARLNVTKLKLTDVDAEFIGAITGGATVNLLSVPQDNSVTPEKIASGIGSKNINNSGLAQGTIVGTAEVTPFESYIYSVSAVAVLPNKTYTIIDNKGYKYRIFLLDSGGNYISDTINHTFTTGSTTYFIKFATYDDVQHSDLTTKVMVALGAIPFGYEPYGNLIPLDWIETKLGDNIDGKKIVTFGDSITWYDGQNFDASHRERGAKAVGYQSYIRNLLKATVENKGVSGDDATQLSNVVKAYTGFITTDIVTITSGANDHRKGIPLGSLQFIGAAHNTATFIGALQSAIEYILYQKSAIKIILITPIKGWFNESGTADVPNPQGTGIIDIDYVNAIKSIGALYSLPVCDWYNLSGINDITKTAYIGDDSAVFTAYELHPTQAGFKRMADILIPFLKNNI